VKDDDNLSLGAPIVKVGGQEIGVSQREERVAEVYSVTKVDHNIRFLQHSWDVNLQCGVAGLALPKRRCAEKQDQCR
jgi:hypothetical protein